MNWFQKQINRVIPKRTREYNIQTGLSGQAADLTVHEANLKRDMETYLITNANDKDIVRKIHMENPDNYKKRISDWITAKENAEDVRMPDWQDLTEVFTDVNLDSHLTAVTQLMKKYITGKDFHLVKEDGEMDDEKTEMLNAPWFHRFMEFAIDGEIYPYSLIQLGNWEDGFNEIKIVPRQVIIPQIHFVKKSVYDVIEIGGTNEGFYFLEPDLKPYFIWVRSSEWFGMLDKVTAVVLMKKNMMQYWMKFAEKYGVPAIIAYTERADNRKGELEDALNAWGNNFWMTAIKDQDKIELAQPWQSNHEIFLEQMLFANNEISKALAGATGVFDEKAFAGSAEVHERMFAQWAKSLMKKLTWVINRDLLPRMVESYKISQLAGLKFAFDTTESLTTTEKVKNITELKKAGFDVDTDYVTSTTGIPVEPEQKEGELKNMYKAMDMSKYVENPLPTPTKKESREDFIDRCMGDLSTELPDERQRLAVCQKQWTEKPENQFVNIDAKGKRLAVDFDGVIHKYSKGWHDGTIYDPPVAGAKEALGKLKSQGYSILIFSVRANSAKQRSDMKKWLAEHEIPYSSIWDKSKPNVNIFIDDRNIRFTGWGSTLTKIKKFKID
jgi:hypothetical protein